MSVLDFLNSPITRCALLVAVLAVLLAAAFWGLRRFRDYIGEDQTPAGELLTNYLELYEQGVISDAEYRKIKSRLNAGMRRKLDDTGRAG
jgi:hypothetical protein